MKHILFVDDDPNFLAGLLRSLHSMSSDWKMTTASNADEALDIVAQGDIDVVVTDYRMAGKDGLELLKTITQSEQMRDVPVIMLTGSDEVTLKRRALELGAADLLGKPVVREELIARISSVLKLKAYQDELKQMNLNLEAKVQERTAELEQSRLEMIWRLAKAGEYRDEGTGNHVLRVGYYCRAIAEQLRLDDNKIRQIFLTSPLHDIGKIGIPDAVLKKRGAFNDEERTVMEKHCEIGAKILAHPHADTRSLWISGAFSEDSGSKDNDLTKMAAAIALHHHERWDGKGYPNRLAEDQIPIEAQITAVADVYDALSTNRPYKAAYSQEEVMKMMGVEVGLHFSPMVFAAMETSMERILMIKNEISDQLHDDPYEKAA